MGHAFGQAGVRTDQQKVEGGGEVACADVAEFQSFAAALQEVHQQELGSLKEAGLSILVREMRYGGKDVVLQPAP